MKKHLIIWFALALVLEVTVFNYKTWFTWNSSPISLEAEFGEGYERKEDGYQCTTSTASKRQITFPFPETKIQSLEVRIRSKEDESVTVELLADDEANAIPFSLGKRTITDTERSHYLTLHLSGKSTTLILNPTLDKGDTITVESVTANVRIPFSFQPLRIMLVGGMLFFLSQLFRRDRPVGGLYVEKQFASQLLTAAVVVFFAVLAMALSATQPYRYINQSHHKQYPMLARAFTEGRLYIDDTPNEVLEAMDNPYDTTLRKQLLSEAQSSCRWDTAYYNGKYYVYFGVIPVLILYLPWYLLTGTDLLNPFAIGITAFFWVIGSYFLWDELVKRWFRSLSWLHGITLYLFFVIGSFGLILADAATFYVLPTVMAVAFGVWGLYLWISSVSEEGGRRTLKLGRVAAGSFCIACIAGCRPQLILIAFAGIPVFAPELKLWKKPRQSPRVYLAAFLPFAAVAAGLMWYNAARFGSPFDFGANYNLTTNDMTRRGIVPGRTMLGLYAYLFQPLHLSSRFPFLQTATLNDNTYYGRTIRESMYGGALMLNLFLWMSVLSLRLKRWFARDTAWYIAVIGVVSAAVIAVIDAQAAGLLYRYIGDFAWMLALSACLTAASVWQRLEGWQSKHALQTGKGWQMDLYGAFLHLIGFLFVYQLIFLLLQLFRGDAGSNFMYLFAFWM